MVKKVCVVTGSRAEFGLLRWVLEGIQDSKALALQLVVTGAHLSPEFGSTSREIDQQGFSIDHEIEMLLSSDTSVGVSKSLGLGVIGFADALHLLSPDLLLVLGDRYEIFAAVTAAMMARIPIAHIHGGELTEGATDDAIRHAITKMSHLHFVAAEDYRARVIQLGEQPERVFNVGGLGVESVKRTSLMGREQVEDALDCKLMKPCFLVTYHPATLDPVKSFAEFLEMLEAFKLLPESQFIFTMPNSDTEGRRIVAMIRQFCDFHPNAKPFDSLGQRLYLSLMAQVDGVVGNSSSGLIEAPAVGVGSLDIGDRQKGRISAPSVLHVEGSREPILSALNSLVLGNNQSGQGQFENPYGDGQTSEKIIEILAGVDLSALLTKVFRDEKRS